MSDNVIETTDESVSSDTLSTPKRKYNVKKSRYLTLKEVCRLLEISIATGKNWKKLGRIKEVETQEGLLFERKEIKKLLTSMRKGDLDGLKSRRNKSALKGRELYVNYVSKVSPNHAAVSSLVNGFSGTQTTVTALLCESFLQLLCSSGKLQRTVEGKLFLAYLKNEFDAGDYEWLLVELMNKTPANSLLKAGQKLQEFTLEYVPYEDTLGLIYLSLMELSKRRQSGRYYTPQNLTDIAVETLNVADGRVFLDPCCGSGNFLLRLLKRGARVEDLYGCDLDGFSVTLARVNFVLSGNTSDKDLLTSHLIQCDTLTSKHLPKVDVVLGNPPWGSLDDPKVAARYAKGLVCADKNRPCLADLFVERSLKLLESGGIVRFVLPEALLNVASHERIRQYISENARVLSVRYLGEVFHAVQCPSVILTLERTSYAGAMGEVIVNNDKETYIVRRKRDRNDFNFKVTDSEALVLSKMEEPENTIRLRGHASFALGIVTGSNSGKIKDSKEDGFEQVIRGSDIEPYKINSPKNFIKSDLSSYQQVAPLEFYRAQNKLVYRFISRYPIVAMDTGGRLTLNSCNVLIPKFENISAVFVMAVLNSSAMRFYFEKKFNTIKVLRSLLEEVPIPLASKEDQMLIEFMVTELNECTDENKQLELRHKIDRKICEIYGLGKRALNTIEN
ncbi:MAG: N-6 DNA methylase [Succinivibrio sp.]|nr:N-6 DNA methylase [Succinivibrio sp.]